MENIHLEASVISKEHWAKKGDVDLFLWNKYLDQPSKKKRNYSFRPWLIDGITTDI